MDFVLMLTKNRVKFYSLIATSLAFLVTSCLTIGANFPSDVAWIKNGKTTRAEIDRVFGEPFRTGYDSSLYTYTFAYYKYNALNTTNTKDLTIRFNNDGTVNSYVFASSFPDDKDFLKPNK